VSPPSLGMAAEELSQLTGRFDAVGVMAWQPTQDE
jgi:hypothetical protein